MATSVAFVVVTDGAGLVQSASEGTTARVGRASTELEGEPLEGLVSERSRVALRALLDRADPGPRHVELVTSQGTFQTCRVRIARVEGDRLTWVFVPSPPVGGSAHEPHLFSRIFACAPDAFVFSDAERRIERLNPAAEALFGVSEGAVRGRSTAAFYADPADFEAQGRRHQDAAPSDPATRRVQYVRDDGATFVGDTVGTRVVNARGETVGYLKIIRDASAEVAREARLAESNRRLEATVEALDQFAAIASHDLRSPLRAVVHLADFIEDDLAPEATARVSRHFERLRARVERMEDMLTGLLEYARRAQEPAPPERLELAALAEALDADLKAEHEAGYRLVVEPPRAGSFTAPGTAIRHALRNLVLNAIRHHDRDEARVVLRLVSVDPLVLEVEDDGPGIPERLHAAVFEVFKTGPVGRAGPTTGLGLAIVRRMLVREGGDVTLTSPVSDGRGCCFRIHFPEAGGR